MSLYQKASLVQIPSGYKASSANLYSVVPNNGDGDFTVSVAAGATRVNKDGLIESVSANQARLNYDFSNPQDPHLLLEPTSANLLQRSEEFDNSYWTKARASITANQTTAPDGANTADKLFDSTDNNTHIVYRSLTVSTSNSYTFSCFLKKGSLDKAFLAFDATASQSVVFDLTNGTVFSEGSGVTSSSIVEYSNGWYKCSFTHTPTTTTRLYRLGTYNGSISYTGTGTDFVYIFGAQVEAGSYPTSYIPTSGSAATRTQDSCLNGGTTSEFNDSEGVLFIESQALANDLSYRFISICDGTTNNRVLISHNTVSNQIRADVIVSGSTQATMTTNSYTITDNHKIAIKYKTNDFALWVDGTEVSTDTFGNTFPSGTLSEINFDNGTLGASFYYEGKLKQLIYFN